MVSKGISLEFLEAITCSSGVRAVQKIAIYLGLPAWVSRSKKSLFAAIEDRVARKLNDWKARSLSIAGKLILIKAIAQAILTYLMSCLLLPEGTCHRLSSLVARFWWGKKNSKSSIHWCSWDKVCAPKKFGGLGLRDFSCFNRALLAKQSWRLLNTPDTILAQSLRIRYFPRTSLLEAKIGYRPSLVWRSIVAGREILSTGIRWNIRNGQSVNVWTDPWILNVPHFRAPMPVEAPAQISRVADLITPEKVWDVDLISSMFPPEVAQNILEIPIITSEENDCVLWDFTKDGTYTVRSGYWLAKSMKDALSSKPSSSTPQPSTWDWIWKLVVPPKIQLFLWRCMRQIIPTRSALARRGSIFEQVCPRCGLAAETDAHALRDCEWSSFFWRASVLRLSNPPATCEVPLPDWILAVIKNKEPEFVQLFACHLWALWRARNSLIFEQKLLDHNTCFRMATVSCREYASCHAQIRQPGTHNSRADSWHPPPQGFIKMNCDASVMNGLGAGLGGVFRDEVGIGLVAFATKREVCTNISIAEALACQEGVRIAICRNIRNLIVEADCLELIQELKKTSHPPSYLGNIVASIQGMLHSFDKVEFSWVRRSANVLAHKISRFAFDASCPNMFVGPLPSQFLSTVNDEAQIP